MKNIINLSGGKDSTAMLLMCLENGYRIDDVVFCDTTVEFPQMYEHLEKLQSNIPLRINIIKQPYSFEYMMLYYEKKKGKNAGKKGYSFPDFRNRWCTAYFKREAIKKYVKQKYGKEDVCNFIGIAVDEQNRINKPLLLENKVKYPLIDFNMTEKDCLNYCYSKGYDWGGLYKLFDRVSCWCCPLKRIGEKEKLYKHFPELWDKLKEWESKTYRKYTNNYSILELENKFNKRK